VKYAAEKQVQRELKLELESEMGGRFSIVEDMLEELYIHRYW
jgi:hypothetical protein